MAIPVAGVTPELRAFLSDLEGRVGRLETPQGFQPAYLTTSGQLSTANAAQAAQRWAILTDLKTVAYSDGAHWRRTDTGAVII